jgi:hypothetical protein
VIWGIAAMMKLFQRGLAGEPDTILRAGLDVTTKSTPPFGTMPDRVTNISWHHIPMLFRVLTGRIEGSWIRIAEPGHMETADLNPLPVEILKTESLTELTNPGLRLVMPGKHIHCMLNKY